MSIRRTDRRRKFAAAAFVLGAALPAAVLILHPASGPSTAQAGATPPARVLHFLEKNEITNLIDNPPRATHPEDISPGDSAAETAEIWTVTKPSRRIGTIHELCTVTLAGPHAAATCNGTLVLPSGTLAINNFFRFADDEHLVAITGGTGAYEGARGSLSGRSTPGDPETNILAIRLLR